MSISCNAKCGRNAVLKRPKTGHALCKECFFHAFELEIHFTITGGKLFKKGDRVAIGASGGKDSTVLAYILKLLNDRYSYGLDLFLLSIDEGISGYRDDSLETVKKNRDDYGLPLKILSYKDLYGWTMDEIVKQIGLKNNCTFCGVFRRQALDRGAALLKANMIVTGHNADDVAETVLLNVLRGDIARLQRCTNIVTEGEGTISRCKPLIYTYEKEIVMYAYYKNLIYFSTECIYSPNAYRGHVRAYIKDVERLRPSCILDIIHSGEEMSVKDEVKLKLPERRMCSRCGFIASQEICKACVLLEGLNRGMPKLGLGKSNKAKRILGMPVGNEENNKLRTLKSMNKMGKSKQKKCKNSPQLNETCELNSLQLDDRNLEKVCNQNSCKGQCISKTSKTKEVTSENESFNSDNDDEEFFLNPSKPNAYRKFLSEMKSGNEYVFLNESSSSTDNLENQHLGNEEDIIDSFLNSFNFEEPEAKLSTSQEPTIIKSKGKTVRPKLILPEMIPRASNRLEF